MYEGIRFVLREPALRVFLGLSTAGNFLIAPLAALLIPVYARTELGGAQSLALLTAAYGAGGLAGAVGFAAGSTRIPRRRLFVAIWLVYPVMSFVFVALPPAALAAVALAVVGLLAGAHGPIDQLVRQERTPSELRGRVFALFMASLTLAVPPAVLLSGIVVEAAGLRAGFLLFACGNLLLALAVFASSARSAL